ncbi:hypothetical protein YB2330_005075 [Saitoella coloradoensis]
MLARTLRASPLARRAAAQRSAATHSPQQPEDHHTSSTDGGEPLVSPGFAKFVLGTIALVTLVQFENSYSAKHTKDGKSFFTRSMETYMVPEKEADRINLKQQEYAQRAAETRKLFMSGQGPELNRLKDWEQFNAGSPYNIAPGSQADVSGVKPRLD